ncbi:hypothetical protein BCR42DRAFT_427503 [Absidia repens]|uniref:Polysaccharide lyase 14 domain-containing protein n=1 Tax=Absidia repens TaxID=90262 RepID=A0A1X2HZP3_9FUNG|nr:hypothetical protein BCR42DRAFT_427503 [Absidia repens]
MKLIELVSSTLLVSYFFEAAAAGSSWNFANWQSYAKETPSSDPSWKSKWHIPDEGGWSWPWHANDYNYAVVNDPAKASKEKGVLQVTYPANSMNPDATVQGGIGFYAQPITLARAPALLDLSYQLFFPKNFDFVKGGKLPGLYGGHEKCSSGSTSSTCFSTRFMWRENGKGEIYAYLPPKLQAKDICKGNGNICNSDYGYSLGRGSWSFKTNTWNSVRQLVKLNTPGKQNGELTVFVNGKQVYKQSNLVYRTGSTDKMFGIVFDTFFGGSSSDFKTPKTQHTYFKGFTLKAQ